ncbi:portal protein [Candidatus Saganbacteria bacterium CG08_land_8_20_14_0_20_45_16]|uniref:Trk system potassium uptake protein TrkA n=1 Tax=Candidatus Saganbacteria bacterium CG08_land_8_20_14_0_20_45_16 TaxID=2014293 RepID=A0A2H0Y0D8_UNCSA|nr:MAG: portal protein [Candidatus Saganbacteria bacterium CG08_land_8_20_14_0_20_45_16]
MYVLIVGGGKVGNFLAKTLSKESFDVAIVEKEDSFAQRIAEELDHVLVIAGDGCDPAKLEDAGIARAQVVVAVTGDDEDNLIICQLAKDTFGVPRVIARVNNPRNETTFQKLGLDTVSSTTIITKLIEEEATIGDIFTLLALKRGKLSIVEAILNTKSPAVDKTIKELKLPVQSILATIIRDNQIIFPKGETKLLAGDSVIALSSFDQESALREALQGKE